METLSQKLEKIKGFGKYEFPVEVGTIKIKCRTLSTEDEANIHLVLAEAGYTGYAYWYAYKVFKVAKAIVEIQGEAWPLGFKAGDYPKDTNPEVYLRELLWTWDEEVFRLLYRIINLKMKIFAGKILEENGIEKFLNPEELGLLRKMEILEKVETEFGAKAIEDVEAIKKQKESQIGE